MLHFAEGSPTTAISPERAQALVERLVAELGEPRRVLLIPPDFTRQYSGAGGLTVMLYERLATRGQVEILPALGTHAAMTAGEREAMFPGLPASAFHVHEWRRGLARLGEVPAPVVERITAGRLSFAISCEVNPLLVERPWDRIVSIGQVVPHEVAGLANHYKAILVGVGGPDTINKTHYVGAVHGVEATLGRRRTPVRTLLAYMAAEFLRDLPITYVLTVRGPDVDGALVTRGLFAGDDEACFEPAAALARDVNITRLDEPVRRAVVYLDPTRYKSTWLGNKAIYRTRLALADGGELIILAPGVGTFGEDAAIDDLIRRFGYRGTPQTLRMVRENADLADNLCAAAHLIHGSTEGRFRVIYCPGRLTRDEVEAVGYEWADLAEMQARYDPAALRDGWNDVGGERVYFVSDPGLGLWANRERLATIDRVMEEDADDAR
ncbi:MAG: lactate racemase domain-containing protein [Phycisphaerae bacterium]